MRIFITGGTGFVGRYVVRKLSEDKEIILPTRNIKKAKQLFPEENIKAIHFQEDLDYLIKKYQPDIVINLLGILFEDKKKGITFEKVHFEYTKKLVDASSETDVKKFIQMSALGADPNSKSRYQRTRSIAEEYIQSSHLEYVILRPSIILGKEQKLFEDMKKFAKIAPFIFAPPGKVQPVHVLDVRDCILKSINEKNEIFELCGDKVITFTQLFRFVLSYLGYKKSVIEMPKAFFRVMLPVFQLFPKPPMTKDQYYMLEKDNICSGKYKGVKELIGKIRNPFEF
ncbi:complex I NDUFA9 subunit family protein [Persephonella sp.]